jgi:ParB family chromosome partitioning protein
MPKNDSRLGRGLSAIFGDIENIEDESKIETISLELITKNPYQPREEFDTEALSELAESIKEKGVIQPILVRMVEDKYEIIAGERRYLAAKMANLKSIPAVVRNVSDKESAEIALIENLQRKDLNPIEEAFAYKNLMEKFLYTQEDVAKKVGKDRATVANTLRLLNLPKEVIEMLKKNEISAGHARAILSLKDEISQKELAKNIKEKKISVREAEEKAKQNKDIYEYKKYEKKLKSIFDKASIKHKKNKGIIEIEFKDENELNNILERIGL